ncbi:MAG: hypothetical protein IKS20_08660 [Victivallales bacterium]|nr:hypothetical protein [Victivallales bacterium]
MEIRCHEPAADKLAAAFSGQGGQVWNDDCVEIFFNSGDRNRLLNQFVVSAGGGRWMGRGTGEPVNEYTAWKAVVAKEKDAWLVKAEIPFTLLGWSKAPASNELLRFNIARNRTPVRETSSAAYFAESLHDKKGWGYFFPYGTQVWCNAVKGGLRAKAASRQSLLAEINAWESSGKPALDLARYNYFSKKLLESSLSGRKFVVTMPPITTDPAIPYLPYTLENPPEKLALRAAGNERFMVPLVLTNLTGAVEEYRVVLSALNERNGEKGVLESEEGKAFPTGNARLFRGVRVKDNEAEMPSLRYDPLVPMEAAATIVVPGRESVPLWVSLDTAGVAPGIYKGVLRIIPLCAQNTAKNPSMQDLPFSFQVLPFELPAFPVLSHFVISSARSKEDFNMMLDNYQTQFELSVWRTSWDVQDDGTMILKSSKGMEEQLEQYLAWARERGLDKRISFWFGYSAYPHFQKHLLKERFKPGSPEWRNAWLSYMRGIDAIRAKHGIEPERWSIEIADEPTEAMLKEFLPAVELAVRNIPHIRFMMTLSARRIAPELLRQALPYVYEWCFWGIGYFNDERYKPLMAELRQGKRKITFYNCSTSMRENLARYYRGHAWNVLLYKLDGCVLYQNTNPRHYANDWKHPAQGEVVLLAGNIPVTTIRNECLNAGINDLRYVAKLRQWAEKLHPDDAICKKIQSFLENAPAELLLRSAGEPDCYERNRDAMIDLILNAETH